MNIFGDRSLAVRATLDSRVVLIVDRVLEVIDITLLCGYRGEEEQNLAFKEKRSKKRFPESEHNHMPSTAVDISPWPIPLRWGAPSKDGLFSHSQMKARAEFYYMAGIVKGIAYYLDIPIRLGADWDGDNSFRDQTFDDLVHVELL